MEKKVKKREIEAHIGFGGWRLQKIGTKAGKHRISNAGVKKRPKR